MNEKRLAEKYAKEELPYIHASFALYARQGISFW